MKKCASCTKDLPDAALHCVFCGAKQAPAAAPASAKTVMGYSADEVKEQLRQQGIQLPQRPAAPAYQPPPAQPAPLSQPQYPPTGPMIPSATPQSAYNPAPQGPALAPAAAASAKTMFVDNGPPPAMQQTLAAPPPPSPMAMQQTLAAPPPPQQAYQPPQPYQPPQQYQPPPYQPPPQAYAPQPVPAVAAVPPYLASQTSARAGRPIEPWKDSLRLMMFVWGALLLAAFATPLSTDPMSFQWDLILHGEGTQKLGPLILAAVGLLSVIIASIPMATAARGLIAGILGLVGVFVPIGLALSGPGSLEWQSLLMIIGPLVLVPALLAREEYRDASLPRILVTIGALAALAPWVIPDHGTIPIVAMFSFLADAPGIAKVGIGLMLAYVVVIALSLLAWLPAPASGGAKIWAWMIILSGLVFQLTVLLLAGHLGDVVKASPYAAVMSWVAGGLGGGHGGMGLVSVGAAYLALVGYGFATVIGKQLE